MLTNEERVEYEQMLTDAWGNSTRAVTVAGELETMLSDAVQAGRPWAEHVLADALAAGLQKFAKDWLKQQRKADTKKGPVSLTAGVVADGNYVQLELVDCNLAQLKEKLHERTSQLKAASRNAKVLRALIDVYDRHPKAKTLAAALRAEGVTLDQVLAA